MKPKHFVKKYKLDTVDKFNHKPFVLDFGNEFISRLEVYKTFGNWGVKKFFDLIDEMHKKFEAIDLKCKVQLPDSLWKYMKNAVFMNFFDEEFPETAEDREALRTMNIKELKEWLVSQKEMMSGISANIDRGYAPHGYKVNPYFWSNDVETCEFEWDGAYEKNVIGSLGLKPNYSWQKADAAVYELNDYLINIAWDELTYQLKKVAAVKAKRQFKIHRDWEEKQKEYNEQRRWNWYKFVHEYMFGFSVDRNEYVPYISLLNLQEDFKEADVKESYRKLSLSKHPDKGGSHEDFIELTEAKNKCLEYLSRVK